LNVLFGRENVKQRGGKGLRKLVRQKMRKAAMVILLVASAVQFLCRFSSESNTS
jgi:hypothetical protein